MMRRYIEIGLMRLATLLPGTAKAQGTKLWTVDRYDQVEKGFPDGVAIGSDGGLEAGPSVKLLYDTGKSFVWSLASDAIGNAYLGLGGTAANSAVVMKVGPTGKANQIFEGKELAVQSLRVDSDNAVLAATSPDGKVYRILTDGGAAT